MTKDTYITNSLQNVLELITTEVEEGATGNTPSYEISDDRRRGPSSLRGVPQILEHRINIITGMLAKLNNDYGSETVASAFNAGITERNAVADFVSETLLRQGSTTE